MKSKPEVTRDQVTQLIVNLSTYLEEKILKAEVAHKLNVFDLGNPTRWLYDVDSSSAAAPGNIYRIERYIEPSECGLAAFLFRTIKLVIQIHNECEEGVGQRSALLSYRYLVDFGYQYNHFDGFNGKSIGHAYINEDMDIVYMTWNGDAYR